MEFKVNVPNKLSEITLSQYMKYYKLVEANRDDDNAEAFLSLKMLEIFCNVPYDKAVELRIKDITGIVNIISDTINLKPELVSTFKMGGVEFGFIPKLEDMSFGEYIDLDIFIGDWDKMNKAMAVLYRPIEQKIGGRYRLKPYVPGDYDEIMLNMPMDAVISSLVFFYHLGIELSTGMVNYLETQEVEAIQGLIHSQVNGVGINRFTDSLKEMLGDLTILPH
jgi:hypothetical protein